MTVYNLGVGVSDVTDGAIGLVMQGMADPGQKTTGIGRRLYARTFVIEDRQTRQHNGPFKARINNASTIQIDIVGDDIRPTGGYPDVMYMVVDWS